MLSVATVVVLLPNANPAHLFPRSLSLSFWVIVSVVSCRNDAAKVSDVSAGGLLHNTQHASRFHKISSVGTSHANHLSSETASNSNWPLSSSPLEHNSYSQAATNRFTASNFGPWDVWVGSSSIPTSQGRFKKEVQGLRVIESPQKTATNQTEDFWNASKKPGTTVKIMITKKKILPVYWCYTWHLWKYIVL